METLLIIFGIYAIGVAIALAIACYYIAKYETKENPAIPALFSWVTVFLVVVFVPIFKFISKYIR